MKRQTDAALDKYINKYGCFYMDIAFWFNLVVNKIDAGYGRLNAWWTIAQETKDANGCYIITPDMNGDGDKDDYNELLIGDKTALCKLVGLPIVYVGSFTPDKVSKQCGQFYIGEFYREWTEKGKKKSFTHFVALDDNFAVAYDPIENSNTVKHGKLKTVRVFKRK